MYFTPGYAPHELGDVDVIVHEDRLHVFYLSLPSHDVVGHLVSDDGLTWQRLPNALTTGEPGAFDDDQIWTMGTFERGGRFHMLYTALGTAEAGCVQRTGLAISDDLVHWHKSERNPVVEADGRWYEATREESGRVNWRDPFVFEEDGTLHGLIVARENRGPMNRRGCVGYFTSVDGYRWEVRPPFYTPRVSFDFEVPTLFKLGSRYYLTGICGGHERDVYRVADHLNGPWRRPADDGLLPTPNHAFRTCSWRGKRWLLHWVRGAADWADGSRWCVLAPMKEATASADGALVLAPFAGWSPFHLGSPRETVPDLFVTPAAAGRGTWAVAEDALTSACDPGHSALLTDDEIADAIFEVEVQPSAAAEFGVVVRADGEADAGTFVACVPGRSRVELVNCFVSRGGVHGIRGRGRQAVQTFHHQFGAGPHRLRVVAHGPLVEASVDGRVVLSFLTMRRRRGRWGVFVEDGAAVFRRPRLQPLHPPPGFEGPSLG
jgi:beta-fructofuranosidase